MGVKEGKSSWLPLYCYNCPPGMMHASMTRTDATGRVPSPCPAECPLVWLEGLLHAPAIDGGKLTMRSLTYDVMHLRGGLK